MSSRQQKLEAALRIARQVLQDNLTEIIWLKEMQQIDDALATPPTSEWNEAIDAVEKECFSLLDYENCPAPHNDFADGKRAGLKRAIESIRALKHKE